MCDERGGVSDPEFPFALPELGALIAASPRVVASGPTRADASRANTPTGASYHDGIERYRSSIDQGVWPPVDFNGEFDALGVDVRALAPASAEDETPFPEVPDWLATEDRDVFEAFRGEFAEQRHGPFADLCDFGTENTNDRRIASSPRSHARSPRHIRVPSSSVTREEKHLSAAPTTRVRPPEDSPSSRMTRSTTFRMTKGRMTRARCAARCADRPGTRRSSKRTSGAPRWARARRASPRRSAGKENCSNAPRAQRRRRARRRRRRQTDRPYVRLRTEYRAGSGVRVRVGVLLFLPFLEMLAVARSARRGGRARARRGGGFPQTPTGVFLCGVRGRGVRGRVHGRVRVRDGGVRGGPARDVP